MAEQNRRSERERTGAHERPRECPPLPPPGLDRRQQAKETRVTVDADGGRPAASARGLALVPGRCQPGLGGGLPPSVRKWAGAQPPMVNVSWTTFEIRC